MLVAEPPDQGGEDHGVGAATALQHGGKDAEREIDIAHPTATVDEDAEGVGVGGDTPGEVHGVEKGDGGRELLHPRDGDEDGVEGVDGRLWMGIEQALEEIESIAKLKILGSAPFFDGVLQPSPVGCANDGLGRRCRRRPAHITAFSFPISGRNDSWSPAARSPVRAILQIGRAHV